MLKILSKGCVMCTHKVPRPTHMLNIGYCGPSDARWKGSKLYGQGELQFKGDESDLYLPTTSCLYTHN